MVWGERLEPTRNLIPQFLKYPGIGIDKSADCLADIMLTKIIKNRYDFNTPCCQGLMENAQARGADGECTSF